MIPLKAGPDRAAATVSSDPEEVGSPKKKKRGVFFRKKVVFSNGVCGLNLNFRTFFIGKPVMLNIFERVFISILIIQCENRIICNFFFLANPRLPPTICFTNSPIGPTPGT